MALGIFSRPARRRTITRQNHTRRWLQAILSETGAEAHQAVMIGDTSFDIEMGVAVGFHTIGVTCGYHTTEALISAGVDQLIDS